MKIIIKVGFSCASFFMATWLVAQVPQMVRYQSALVLGGTNYHGVGYFKFALINREAMITYWSNDGSSVAAAEPQGGLDLEVNQGFYEVLLGDTTLANMRPLPPAVFTNANLHIRVWFSTGTGPYQAVMPDQPMAAAGYAMMSAKVAEGAVTAVNLAEGAVTAGKLAPNAVTSASIAPAAIGAPQLAPNAAAANLQSSGGLILSSQANATNLIQAGFKKIGTVAAETEMWSSNSVFCPSPRAGHLAVWTGQEMILWAGVTNAGWVERGSGGLFNPTTETWRPMSTSNTALVAYPSTKGTGAVWANEEMIAFTDGGLSGRAYNPATDTWRRLATANAPDNLVGATFVWTGEELLVFGSTARHRYQPATDTWRLMSTTNLIPRRYHSAIWTGQEMIVWGGEASGYAKTRGGARYNPATDTWRIINASQAPTARSGHSAVWTGREMVIWGGEVTANTAETQTGGVYDAVDDTWKAISTNNAPLARQQHFACLKGSTMIVWGGHGITTGSQALKQRTAFNDGARYNLTTGAWTPISLPPSDPILAYTAVWTGSEMMIWGGGYLSPLAYSTTTMAASQPFSNAGLRYNPGTDQWRFMPFAPPGRIGHTVVWTGKELITWGGARNAIVSIDGTSLLASGGRFNPVTGKWYPISSRNSPTPRKGHQAVWTGAEMIVWGGEGSTNGPTQRRVNALNTGARYQPATDTWIAMDTNGAPSPRTGFTMVWSGREALVFGGQNPYYSMYASRFGGSGACYNPQLDQWTSISAFNAPSPRYLHTAVWTGEEMIIWGGLGPRTTTPQVQIGYPQQNGARYNPVLNAWVATSTNGSPVVSTNLTACWTGQEMLLFATPSPQSSGRYNPLLDRWDSLPLAGIVTTSYDPVGVWTGKEFIVLTGAVPPGNRFDPVKETWTPMTTTGAPARRLQAEGVWTGSEMLVFGGMFSSRFLPTDVLRYSMSAELFLYGRP